MKLNKNGRILAHNKDYLKESSCSSRSPKMSIFRASNGNVVGSG